MRRQIVILIAWLGIGFAVQAQDKNVKFTTAMVDYNEGNYAAAMKNFEVALAGGHEGLSEKNIPKAYYHRAKCRFNLLSQAMQKRDTVYLKENKNALFLSYDDYKKAKETDDGKWGEKVTAELNTVTMASLQAGLMGLNLAYKLDEIEQAESVTEIMPYFDLVAKEKPDDYVAFDLRGQAKLIVKDESGAYSDLKKAADLFQAKLPARADQVIGYAFYRMATIERKTDPDKALKTILLGMQVLEKEHVRALGAEGISDEKKAEADKQFQQILEDLKLFELDIYRDFPEKREEALAKFASAVAENPKDYNMHLVYASMLEDQDKEKAISVYEKAISIKPDGELAHFNLGALYNNIAKGWYDNAMSQKDYTKTDSLQKIGDSFFLKAYPHFQAALDANPSSLQTIRALKQIAIRFEKMDDHAKYSEMEKKLMGQ